MSKQQVVPYYLKAQDLFQKQRQMSKMIYFTYSCDENKSFIMNLSKEGLKACLRITRKNRSEKAQAAQLPQSDSQILKTQIQTLQDKLQCSQEYKSAHRICTKTEKMRRTIFRWILLYLTGVLDDKKFLLKKMMVGCLMAYRLWLRS